MTSRFPFARSTALLASVLVLASGCSDQFTVPVDAQGGGEGDEGGEDGNGDGDGDGGFSRSGECPSGNLVQGICQPDAPVLSSARDCDSGAAEDGVCQPAALEAPAAGDCLAPTDGVCAPAPPAFADWACPPGWEAVPGLRAENGGTLGVEGAGAFRACQAVWAEDCAPGSLPRVGASTCAAVFDDCPAGPWPPEAELRVAAGEDFGGGLVFYVDPSAAAAGDGATPEAPFNSLAAALAAAGDGDIVALARGNHAVAAFEIDRRVALVGACASETQLSPSTPSETAPLILLTGTGARIADLTVTGDRPGISVEQVASSSLERVQVLEALGTGVSVSGAGASLASVLIRDTQPSAAQGGGSGLRVVGGGSAELSSVALPSNRGAALRVSGEGSIVFADDLLVAGTLPGAAGTPGRGVVVSDGGSATLNRAAVLRSEDAGILAESGSELFLTDVFITATSAAAAGSFAGAALSASGGARVSAERLMAIQNAGGLRAAGAETTLELRDAVVNDTAPGESDGAGAGLWSQSGAAISGERVVLLRNPAGIVAEQGSLDLDQLVIADSGGPALESAGADVSLAQAAFSNNGGGLSFTLGGTLDLADLRVAGTRGRAGAESRALFVDAAGGVLQRVALLRNPEYGLFVSGAGTELDITDLRVSETLAVDEAGGSARGIGVAITDPAGTPTVLLQRGLISRSHGYGLLVNGPGAQVVLRDVSVLETQAVSNPARGGGILFMNPAPAAQPAGGSLSLERGRVEGNAGSGVTIAGPGIELSLSDVNILDSALLSDGEAAGLWVRGGASALAERVVLAGNARTGVAVEGPGTELDAVDLAVRDTQPASSGEPSGEGVRVVGGTLRLTSAALLRNASAGIWAARGASVELLDVTLQDTRASAGSGSGVGIDVIAAELNGERVSIARSHGLGLSASLGALVSLGDVSITQTEAQPSMLGGRGVEVTFGAQVELERALVANSRDYAVVVAGPDLPQATELLQRFPRDPQQPLPERTELALYDASVHDTLAAACADSSCADRSGGGGIAVLGAARLELDTFDIRTSALVGMQLVEGAVLDAANGAITANPVGVNVQSSGVDLEQSFSAVRVFDNQVDQDTRDLPVPGLSDVLGRSNRRLEPEPIPSPR